MSEAKYFFQNQKRNITQRFFEKGLTATAYILFALKEQGKLFLREMPSCYPSIKLMKDIFGVNYKKPEFKEQTIRTNFRRLEKQGLIIKDSKRKIYCLTNKGREFTSYIEDRYLILKNAWDGKLRIVIFDIPEKRKGWRKLFRQELIFLQFQQLQKSVYIGKYPLPKSLYKEIAESGLSQYIFILTVNDIERKKEILEMLEK